MMSRGTVAKPERGLVAIEPDIGERAPGAFLRGPCQDRLELGIGHAHEALDWIGVGSSDPPPVAQPILAPQKDV